MLDELAANLGTTTTLSSPSCAPYFCLRTFTANPLWARKSKAPFSFWSLLESFGKNPPPTFPATNLPTGTGQSAERQRMGRRACLAESINDSLRNNLIGHLLFSKQRRGLPRFAYSTRYSNAPAEARQRDRDEALAFSSESGSVHFQPRPPRRMLRKESDISMMASTALSGAASRADYDLKLGLAAASPKAMSASDQPSHACSV